MTATPADLTRTRRNPPRKVLDLFCGAGGAAMGLHRAWPDVEIVGVDNRPQPRYPFRFVQADAMTFDLHGYDFIWASPPCHEYSTGTRHRKNAGIVYPDLLPVTQQALRASGQPFVIENVPGAARLMHDPVMLCGGMFGLGVMRHRFFEANWPLVAPAHKCNGREIDRDEVSVTRHGPPARWYRNNPGRSFSISTWHRAMGIDWMNRVALTQAVPPAYSEYIARQYMEQP